MAQPGAREAGYAGIQQHAIHVALVLRRGRAREGQRRRPQVEVEQAVAETGLVVVVALGPRGGDDFDLPPVEAEALVDRANLRQIGRDTSELQSLMRNSYAVFCLKKKNTSLPKTAHTHNEYL